MLKKLLQKLDKPAVHVQFAQLDTRYLTPEINDRVFYWVSLYLLAEVADLSWHF